MAKTSRRARRTSAFYLPSAFDLFTPSKELVLNKIWIFGPLYAIPFIFYIHSWIWQPLPGQHVHFWQHADGFSSGWPGSSFPSYLTFLTVGYSLLWALIIVIAGTIVQIMTNAAQLMAARGDRLDFKDLWQVVRELGWRMFGLYVVMALIFIAGLLPVLLLELLLGGFGAVIGLIISFVIFVILIKRLFLAPYVMLDKNTGISETLTQSSALSAQNPGAIWGVIGVMILIGLLNIVPIIGGLAAFAFGALYSIAPAFRYEQLKKLI